MEFMALRSREDTSVYLTAFLGWLGWMDLLLGPAACLILLSRRLGSTPTAGMEEVGLWLLALLASLTLGGLLLGLSGVMKLLDRAPRPEGDESDPLHESPSALDWDNLRDSDRPATEGPWRRELLHTLRELRDWTALRDGAESGSDVKEALQRQVGQEVVDALNQRRLGLARQLLRQAEARWGPSELTAKLAGTVLEASRRYEPLDYARARRLVDDAIQSGRWAVAKAAAQALYQDHSESTRCRKLWEDTRKARLYAYIDMHVQQRHWQESLAAANEFLVRFPQSSEAALLRAKLADLKHNAEVEQRRQLEERFHERVRLNDPAEALSIARYLLDHYPRSPQARALAPRIPELETQAARIGLDEGPPAAAETTHD